jgi:hypothetical protein
MISEGNTMKKRLMSILICALLLVMAIPGIAYADQGDATDAQFDKLAQMVDKANDKILKEVEKAQQTPVDDVDDMLAAVDAIVADVLAYANSIGATVVCEYTEYYVDGQYVLVDPLRIIPL